MTETEGKWVMQGLSIHDPDCITSPGMLENYILQVGFLPLFRNEIPGFSVEEHTATDGWWTGEEALDPWEWRKILAANGKVAYGKFFDRKAGFISKEWFPAFANYRRDGYDFDARWDDELASIRSKKIMDLFAEEEADRELFSSEVKQLAGFGGSGEKNFEGEITKLQMQTYLCVRDFRRRRNKKGEEYGWGIAVYCLPEHLWGYEWVTGEYSTDPKESAHKIFAHMKEQYPDAPQRQLARVLGLRETGTAGEKTKLPYPDNLIKALKVEGFQADTATPDQLMGLEVALGQLREKQQRVIRMKYREHMKNEAIGEIMNRAAGTIGTYHTKALGKLRWKSIAPWYTDGYEFTLKRYLKEKGREYPPVIRSKEGEICGEDLCLSVGISLKQFEALHRYGIKTVTDLRNAVQKPDWFAPVPGIGPKTALDIYGKLETVLRKNGWQQSQ